MLLFYSFFTHYKVHVFFLVDIYNIKLEVYGKFNFKLELKIKEVVFGIEIRTLLDLARRIKGLGPVRSAVEN